MRADTNATVARRNLAAALYERLVPLWPDQGPLLHYSTCFELLVAVILSAQCTDEQVNAVTPALFAAYPDPARMAVADPLHLEKLVHSTGFFRAKAANIRATAAMIMSDYSGSVPDTMEELVRLPGVGRKTANLVISACFGKPGIVVDTHVLRTARRLGLAPTDDAGQSERMIASACPENRWTELSFALNRLGKLVCVARSPRCDSCPVSDLCVSAFKADGEKPHKRTRR